MSINYLFNRDNSDFTDITSQKGFSMDLKNIGIGTVSLIVIACIIYGVTHTGAPEPQTAQASIEPRYEALKTMGASNSGQMAAKCHKYCGGPAMDQEVCAEAMLKGGEAVQKEQQRLVDTDLDAGTKITPEAVKATVKANTLPKVVDLGKGGF